MKAVGLDHPPSLYGWMAAAGKRLDSRFERRSAAIRGEILKQVQDDSIRWLRNSVIYEIRIAQKDI
jgi:hypothetical protein